MMMKHTTLSALIGLLFTPSLTTGFLSQIHPTLQHGSSLYMTTINQDDDSRRALLGSTVATLTTTLFTPTLANAGIDVSSLQTGSGSMKDQLKAYENGGASMVPKVAETKPTPIPTSPSTVPQQVPKGVATLALRTTNVPPLLRKINLGTTVRLTDQLQAPSTSKFKSLSIAVEFPSDWLELDRLLGGLEYVDQRNGDKWYILRSDLPSETTLETVPKAWFGESIFDSKGSIAQGNTIEDYKVSSSQLSSVVGACPPGSAGAACQYPRRRLNVKYATVTGNGLRVERRALVDAYEVDGVAYMLMVTQNAVKFEAKGRERETVDAIAESFRLER